MGGACGGDVAVAGLPTGAFGAVGAGCQLVSTTKSARRLGASFEGALAECVFGVVLIGDTVAFAAIGFGADITG